MRDGDFLSKDAEEAWDYLDTLLENSQKWEIEDAIERTTKNCHDRLRWDL